MTNNNSFKPYVDSGRSLSEITISSVISGILISIVFGAANAYLGLRVGLTVSASIPAAVIGMSIYRVISRKETILESNMVQTIGSAGESVAAGAIFTLPALFLWAKEGICNLPGVLEIGLIAIFGSLLGVCLMVPLRKSLIVQEHGTLPYPEGTACAEVLLSGEKKGSQAKSVMYGMAFGALVKLIIDGLHLVADTIVVKTSKFHGEIHSNVYPALVGVGYICGLKIATLMFAGSLLGWVVIIPMIHTFGQDAVMFPAKITIGEIWENAGAAGLWSSYLRYIGAGAVAGAGIISLIKNLPSMFKSFGASVKGLKNSSGATSSERTDKDLPLTVILVMILVLLVLIAALPIIPVGPFGTLLILIFGFFFASVSARMTGIVGSSNNPASGMTIATLLVVTILLKVTGHVGAAGMVSALTIGAVICIVVALAGDMAQDLKTGYILGATPQKQQVGEFIGGVTAAIAIGFILYLLNNAWGFGSAELAAPQATLMKMIVEGVMNGNLPWALVFMGAFIAVIIELLGLPSLPFALGLYLPIALNACIFVGGVIRNIADKFKYKSEEEKLEKINSGILCCSGMIAGEGLTGILFAILAVVSLGNGKTLLDAINIGAKFNLGQIGSLLVLAAIVFYLLKNTVLSKTEEK
ncbi:MAG: oligopeptide transporter, OPT family [Spirochaetales bacterium]|nr:oligopeptide transporter, OPT family [Spirochaetales bacterium]